MKRWIWIRVGTLVGLLAATGPVQGMVPLSDEPIPAQTAGGGVGVFDPSGLSAVVSAAIMAAAGPESKADKAALVAAQAKAALMAEKVRNLRSRVDAGLAPASELSEAEVAHKEALAEVAEQEEEVAAVRALFGMPSGVGGKLSKPVDVQLQQATVRQAAEALAKASGIPIEVGESVPKDLRITIDARRMPLSTVLEAIGKQTGLMIAPQGEGVRLDVWPSLTVDGVKTTQRSGRMAPWSDEWGIPPTAFSRLPGALTVLPGFTGGGSGGGVAARAFSSGARPNGLEVSISGDTVVVSEVGTNAEGEAGLWLTAYRVVSGKMEPAGSTFHPFRGNTAGGVAELRFDPFSALRGPTDTVRPARPPAPPRPPASR